MQNIIEQSLLFEINDIFGKRIRLTKSYWSKIKTEKHIELELNQEEVIQTLIKPDEVFISVKDAYIRIFYKNFDDITLVVLVKYLNGNGFVVTVYQTTKIKRKGDKIWPK